MKRRGCDWCGSNKRPKDGPIRDLEITMLQPGTDAKNDSQVPDSVS